jgi:UDP-glucose 4-epimerase
MLRSNENAAIVVTGSSGFIGRHAADRLSWRAPLFLDREAPDAPVRHRTELVDLCNWENLAGLRNGNGSVRLLHLAAEAEVVIPWRRVGDVVRSNEIGTHNVLSVFKPDLTVFASTSAIYGNAGVECTAPSFDSVKPLGLYGASKFMGEMMLRDWARETGGSAVAFRLGNVVGPRCRGLIPYLVNHARAFPDGAVPARMRGFGRLIRDYIPVSYITGVFAEALDMDWPRGTFTVFNAGTGRGMSNRQVAAIVRDELSKRSIALNIAWEDPVAPGEAESVVLDVEETARRFSLAIASEDDVRAAIEQGVQSYLEDS